MRVFYVLKLVNNPYILFYHSSISFIYILYTFNNTINKWYHRIFLYNLFIFSILEQVIEAMHDGINSMVSHHHNITFQFMKQIVGASSSEEITSMIGLNTYIYLIQVVYAIFTKLFTSLLFIYYIILFKQQLAITIETLGSDARCIRVHESDVTSSNGTLTSMRHSDEGISAPLLHRVQASMAVMDLNADPISLESEVQIDIH